MDFLRNKGVLAALFLCVCAALYLFMGKEEPPEKRILGTWEAQNLAHESIVTFRKDGTMTDVIPKDPIVNAVMKPLLGFEFGGTFTGTWEMKGNKLTTILSDGEGTLQDFKTTGTFEFKGKNLYLNDGFKVIHYRRVKR